MHIKSDGQNERGVFEARAGGLKVIERWGKMEVQKRRRGESLWETVWGSDSTWIPSR